LSPVVVAVVLADHKVVAVVAVVYVLVMWVLQ
jgi:hypothetical protein